MVLNESVSIPFQVPETTGTTASTPKQNLGTNRATARGLGANERS